MKYILTFLDYRNKSHHVGEIDDLKDGYKLIEKEMNKRYPNFKIYYIRSWGDIEKEGITFDVGSHTEFFKLCKKN